MNFHIEKNEGHLRLSLIGALKDDTASVLEEVRDKIDVEDFSDLTIDLSKMTGMSSIGVATWIRFVDHFRSRKKVELSQCPIFFVDYCNMMPDVYRDMHVSTFEVPLQCPQCRKESSGFFPTKEFSTDNCGQCKKCGTALTSDVHQEAYFDFLKS